MFGRVPQGPLVGRIDQVSTGRISKESVVQVKGAKVVCANYRAIVHDFPQVFGPAARRDSGLVGCDACAAADRLCPGAINTWLIRNSAYVSQQQARPNEVNSPIACDGLVRTAYRPPQYGRAIVVPVDCADQTVGAQFLDLKGAGVAPGNQPGHGPYQSGLEYLGFAIADFFYGWLIDSIFARTFPGYHIVPVYAVLDLGFDIINGWHGTAPAGMHVRRAHPRPIPEETLPSAGSDREKLDLHIEYLLRAFGLSTTGAGTAFHLADPDERCEAQLRYKGKPVEPNLDQEREMASRIARAIVASSGDCLEVTNVQMAAGGSWPDKTAQIYDFGQVRAERSFPNPVANAVRAAPLNIGRILSPGERGFVQPIPEISVDADLGNRRTVNANAFYAAQSFRSEGGLFGQREIETMLRIARLKVMRRDFDWAVRKAAQSACVEGAAACSFSGQNLTGL